MGVGSKNRTASSVVRTANCTHTHTLTNAQASLTKTSKQTWGPGQTSAPSQTPCICHTWRLAWPRPWRLLCPFHRVTHTEDVVGQHHHLAGPIWLQMHTALHAVPTNFCLVPCLQVGSLPFFAARLLSDRPSPIAGGLGFQTGDSIRVLPQAPGPLLPPGAAQPHHQTSSSAVAQSAWPAELLSTQ